jgi:hypothetical protein
MPAKKPSLMSVGSRSHKPAPKPVPTAAAKAKFTGRVVRVHEIAKSVLTHEVPVPSSMNQVKFIAGNPTDEPVGIEFTGGFLTPECSDNQRLLIAGAADAIEGIGVLQPGETRTFNLLTACMDQSKSPPDGDTKYSVADKPAPEKFQSVARRFNDLACNGPSKLLGGLRGQSMETRRLVRKMTGVGISVGDFQGETWKVSKE